MSLCLLARETQSESVSVCLGGGGERESGDEVHAMLSGSADKAAANKSHATSYAPHTCHRRSQHVCGAYEVAYAHVCAMLRVSADKAAAEKASQRVDLPSTPRRPHVRLLDDEFDEVV